MYRATITRTTELDHDADPRDYCDCEHCQENIKRWLDDQWHYWGVIVTATIHAEIDGHPFTCVEDNSLWGVDDVDPTYPETVAKELAAELIAQLERNFPGIAIEEE